MTFKDRILDEVTTDTLQKGDKKVFDNLKNKGGVHVKKDQKDLIPSSHPLSIQLTNAGLDKAGPTTSPRFSETGKQAMQNATGSSPLPPGIYSKGNILPQLDKIRGKQTEANGGLHKAMNALFNNHELNEYKSFKKNNPQTASGQQLGHHSVAKIIGNERVINRTAEDKHLTQATDYLNDFRNDTHENDIFKRFAPVDQNGVNHLQNDPKNDPFRMNRRYLDQVYKKEMGLPADISKQDFKKFKRDSDFGMYQ